MFFHDKRLQYEAKPQHPDPIYAKKLQEIVGGQFGEMTVMMQYLFQGWNCRGPAKYRDMLLDIGTEEIAHVEMLCTMIARLLEKAPISTQEDGAKHPGVGAAMGGGNVQDVLLASMNPQHAIVTGLGPAASDSMGIPWNGHYIISSGNLLADFRANLNAESQGRLQAVRLFEMTDDPGVRDMLSFLIARDSMHQLQWMAAIEDLEASGLEKGVVPGAFPENLQKNEVATQFWNCSAGGESSRGRWAKGPTPIGKGEFEYVANPQPMGAAPTTPPQANPKVYDTGRLAVAGSL
jgi:Mn-containing catalase